MNLSKKELCFISDVCMFVVVGARGVGGCSMDQKRPSLKRVPPDQLSWLIRCSESNIWFNQIGCPMTMRMRGRYFGSPFHCCAGVNLIRNEKFVRDKKLTTFIIKCREELPVTSFWWWALGGSLGGR